MDDLSTPVIVLALLSIVGAAVVVGLAVEAAIDREARTAGVLVTCGVLAFGAFLLALR